MTSEVAEGQRSVIFPPPLPLLTLHNIANFFVFLPIDKISQMVPPPLPSNHRVSSLFSTELPPNRDKPIDWQFNETVLIKILLFVHDYFERAVFLRLEE